MGSAVSTRSKKQRPSQRGLARLPIVCQAIVCSFLDIRQHLVVFARVCRAFNEAASTAASWCGDSLDIRTLPMAGRLEYAYNSAIPRQIAAGLCVAIQNRNLCVRKADTNQGTGRFAQILSCLLANVRRIDAVGRGARTCVGQLTDLSIENYSAVLLCTISDVGSYGYTFDKLARLIVGNMTVFGQLRDDQGVQGVHVADAIWAEAALPSLEHLVVTDRTPGVLAALKRVFGRCKTIACVDLIRAVLIWSQDVAQLRRAFPAVKELSLYVSGDGVRSVAQTFRTALVKLRVFRAAGDMEQFAALSHCCPNLRSLQFIVEVGAAKREGCKSLLDSSLAGLTQQYTSLPSVRSLEIEVVKRADVVESGDASDMSTAIVPMREIRAIFPNLETLAVSTAHACMAWDSSVLAKWYSLCGFRIRRGIVTSATMHEMAQMARERPAEHRLYAMVD